MSVGKKFAVRLEDLGGGLNEDAPSHLTDRDFMRLVNFHPFGTRLIRRGGLVSLSSAYGENLTSLFGYTRSIGDWLLLVGTQTGIARLDHGTLIPLAHDAAYGSLPDPWIMRQYKDEVFACRKQTGTIKRVTADLMMSAGLAAPLTAATIAQGAAGSKEAGDRILVYTYYVKETGAESNPSPASNTLALAANKKLVANGVLASPNPQVNARRLYETAPGQSGRYFFVKQQDDNLTVDGIENDVKVDDLGSAASFENGVPPDGIIALEIMRERLFATDGKYVYWSQIGVMQAFSEYDFTPVNPDDGHKIVDLVAWGDVLAVPKTGGMFILKGSGAKTFAAEVISDKHGARGYSTKSAEGTLIWYSGENIYSSVGGPASALSTVRLRKTLDRIPEAYKHLVIAEVLPRKSLYLLGVPLDSATSISHLIAYNYKTDAWDVVQLSQAPSFFARCYDANYNEVLYGTFPDRCVYEMETGNTDAGTAIVATGRSRGLDYGQGSVAKCVRTVGFDTPATVGTLKVRVYNDGKDTYVKERTIDLSRAGWKRVNISTFGQPAATHAIEWEYSGAAELEIHGISIEGVMLPGRSPRAQ